MGQTWIVISAVVSALAAVSIAVLTFFLVRATNKYVGETTKYVRLVQEQLDLLRAQLAPPLLLDIELVPDAFLQLFARCRHSGNSSSLNVILKAIEIRMCPLEGGEEAEIADRQGLNDFLLKPGKTWSRHIAVKIAALPTPRPWRFWFRRQTVGRLNVTLQFQRAGQIETGEVQREYEVRTAFFPGPKLYPL